MTRKLVLYIAISLDGYIADKRGSIDFLSLTPLPESDRSYEDFFDTVDTVIMGSTTYLQVVHELSPELWPYQGKKCYVYTSKPEIADEQVEATNLPPKELLQEIRQKGQKNIWLLGGAHLIHQFLEAGLIDEYRVYLMPQLLGGGIRLFSEGEIRRTLQLVSVKAIGEMVELVYQNLI